MTHTPHRPGHIALSLLTAALVLLTFAPASEAKVVVDAFGFPGTEGGHLNTPAGIAINQTGEGGVPAGTIYVAENGNNRIQRLDAEGHFERLWGFDVVQGGGSGFEICTVASECKLGDASQEIANGGEVGQPQGIAVNQTTGNVYVLEWTNHRIEEFDPDGNFLRAFGRDVVSTGGVGDVSSEAYEVCTVAVDCKGGLVDGDAGSISFGRAIAIDSAGNVWLANANNHRIEEFEADGGFIAAYGWDVDALGGSGGLEKCTSTAVGACQAGTVGTELGQFGGNAIGPNPMHLTVDAAGFVYALDQDNNRIQRFDPAAPSATLFAPGLSAEAGLSQITAVEDGIQALPNGHFLLGVDAQGGDRLLDVDASGHLSETSLAGAGVPTLEHFALNESSGAIYASTRNNGGSPGVLVIDDGPATLPTVTIEPPSEIDAESATFHASVDPLDVPVGDCKFEYSTDQVAWTKVPVPSCASLDVEGGSQQVSKAVSTLEPGTHYFVRFSAGRYYNPAATVESDEVEFTTLSAPPIVSDVGAAQVTDTTAYLAGVIKPRSQVSQYHFEYGTTPALGSSTPTVELSGSKEVIVSQQVTELEPSTKYYLRLVVTNVAGTTEGPPAGDPPAEFRTRPTSLPEHRAYEQVSPPDKNFANADFAFSEYAVAGDGDAVAFCMTTGFGEPAGQIGFQCTDYRAKRSEDGWRTRWIGEPYCAADLDASKPRTVVGNVLPHFSPNFDFVVFGRPEPASCPFPPLDPAAPQQQTNLYRADYRSEPILYDLLTPQPESELAEAFSLFQVSEYGAASEDWTRLAYTSTGRQTLDAPAGNFNKVFEWHEGAFKLVSIDPEANPFTASAAVPEDALHGVSVSGNRIFFTTPVSENACASSSCEIYMRQNGLQTFDVSERECTSSCGESAADNFLAATPTGSKALFMSKAKLTNDDTTGNGNDLYLYTQSANPRVNQNLTLLSKDDEPADGSGAEVLGLLGMSDDGETVYFVAAGQIVAGAPTEAGPKVYRWRANGGSPTVEYLATLAKLSPESGSPRDDASNWRGTGQIASRGDSREVSPDGKYLLIHTAAPLDPGADHDSDVDVYRWSEEDGWLCLSCQTPGTPSGGDSTFTVSISGQGGPSASNLYRNVMSEDGKRVFFTSFDALAPGDTNQSQDLYEWHENGLVSLISPGTDTRNVKFLGASKSGDDVFFTTHQRLVGWDTDENADIYDARVGGGFPEPPPPGAPCDPAEGCRGAPSVAPPASGAGTAAFQGPGNPKARFHKTHCRKGKRKVRRHGKVRCIAHRHHGHHHHRHGRRTTNHNRSALG